MYGIFPYIYHRIQLNVGKYMPYVDGMGYSMRLSENWSIHGHFVVFSENCHLTTYDPFLLIGEPTAAYRFLWVKNWPHLTLSANKNDKELPNRYVYCFFIL